MKKALTFFLLFVFVSTPVAWSEEKSPAKAFLLSFIVPGLGQMYAGSTGYAKVFIASELALWGGYYYNYHMKTVSAYDYYSQAAHHAGVDLRGKGGLFLNAIGAYNTSYEYNQNQLMSSFTPIQYNGAQEWQWDREENRLLFRNYRERELEYGNNLKLFIAGVVLNHFLAGLNASKQVNITSEPSPALSVRVLKDGLAATYTRSY